LKILYLKHFEVFIAVWNTYIPDSLPFIASTCLIKMKLPVFYCVSFFFWILPISNNWHFNVLLSFTFVYYNFYLQLVLMSFSLSLRIETASLHSLTALSILIVFLF
jgi:hypothetical protein